MAAVAVRGTENVKEWPPFSIIETWWLDLAIELSLMCGGVRVSVIVSSSDRHTSLGSKLSYFLQNKDEPCVTNEFEEWALAPLIPLLWQLYSQRNQNEQRLLSDYLQPLCLAFRLIDAGRESLLAIPYEGNYTDLVQPVFQSITVGDLTEALNNFRNLEGLFDLNVPFYKDSEIIIEDSKGSNDFYGVPNTVRPFQSKYKMAFKPAASLSSFKNEVCTYLHLKRQQPLGPDAHLLTLAGLVQSATSKRIVGILTPWIDGARVLEDLCEESTPSPDLRLKWEHQIARAVSTLHNSGLVWGNVAPKNVLIDIKLDAWVVDFGGGYSEGWTELEWMDNNQQSTVDGDLKGLERVKRFLRGEYTEQGLRV